MIDFIEYTVFFDFSTFRPLGGRSKSKWSLLLDILTFFDFSISCWEVKLIDFTGYIGLFWLFDFSTCWWEVIIIDFTEYIDFFSTFRLFDILVGGQNDRFYWIYCIFSTFRIFDLLVGSKWSNIINILIFFRLFDFWPLAVRLKCLILLNILKFFDFSTFRTLGGRSEWSNLLNILTSCWEVKLIDFTGYIGFIRLFDFPTLEGGGGGRNWPRGKFHGASVRSNIENTVSVNLTAVYNIQSPEKTKHARTNEWTLLLLTFFIKNTSDTETGYFRATPEINIGIIIPLVLCIRSKRGVLIVPISRLNIYKFFF